MAKALSSCSELAETGGRAELGKPKKGLWERFLFRLHFGIAAWTAGRRNHRRSTRVRCRGFDGRIDIRRANNAATPIELFSQRLRSVAAKLGARLLIGVRRLRASYRDACKRERERDDRMREDRFHSGDNDRRKAAVPVVAHNPKPLSRCIDHAGSKAPLSFGYSPSVSPLPLGGRQLHPSKHVPPRAQRFGPGRSA